MEKTHNEKTREQLEKELEIVEKLQDAIRGQGGREMLLLRNNLYWLWRDLSAKIGNGNPAGADPETNIGDHRMKTNRTQEQKDQEIFLIDNLINVISTMKRGTRGSQFRGQGLRLSSLRYYELEPSCTCHRCN